MFKKNLTHKILPFFALFLLIFNLFFVGTVFGASLNSYEIGFFEGRLYNYIVDIVENNGANYYLAYSTISYDSSYNSYVVYCFNEYPSGQAFYYDTDRGGYGIIRSKLELSGTCYIISTSRSNTDISTVSVTEFNDYIGRIIVRPYGSELFPFYTNIDIYTDPSLQTMCINNLFVKPTFGDTSSSISNLVGGYILIYPGELSPTNSITFNLIRRYSDNHDKDDNVFSCDLTLSSKYYKSITNSSGVLEEFWYEIPYADMYSFEKGQEFTFQLKFEKPNSIGYPYIVYLDATIGSVSTTDKIQDDINTGFDKLKVEFKQSTDKIVQEQQKTQEALKENTETNKNIFQKIGDIFNILNPFSENFFAYKLIDLLLDALKSLFIPSNEFFSNYFSELNEWFSDRFGFLYYPLELFFDLCNRFLNINFNEPIINIPEIKEPATNMTLIHATQYNFNSLLEQNSLKTVHDIYLIIVDAIIYVGLVILLYNKYEEVMTK